MYINDMKIVQTKDIRYRLAPQVMPMAMAKNKNPVSSGSFTAVRNLTIDNAPTIPKDSAIFELMVNTINAVIIQANTSNMLKGYIQDNYKKLWHKR